MKLIEWEIDEDGHPLKSKKGRENDPTCSGRKHCKQDIPHTRHKGNPNVVKVENATGARRPRVTL